MELISNKLAMGFLRVCVLILLLAHVGTFSRPKGSSWLKEHYFKDVNGGIQCATCSALTGLIQQLTEVHAVSVTEAIDMFCKFLPDQFEKVMCRFLVYLYTPAVIKLLEDKDTPDVICHAMGLCRNDTGQFCHLFPLPKHNSVENISIRVTEARKRLLQLPAHRHGQHKEESIPHFCDLFTSLCNALSDHTPLKDDDGDNFSTIGTIRGYYWRGKDCNDKNRDIYPGKYSTNDSTVDTNCNGIMGIDPNSNQTYESLWCNDTQQMGVVVLGDSASAHFHIPPSWITSKEINDETYKDLLLTLENEFDWPMMSTVTGFMNSSWPNSITGKVDSTYLRFLDLNHCNHRDYQSIAVNGARASAMAAEIVKTFARSASDNPVFLTLALIGNDVCNGHPGLDHMTKPEDFYTHMLETLNYLDQHVATGSVVIAMGLVDGRVLYDVLATRIHPIGSLHQDVTYSHLYDYLNCLQISPCFGWLNSNETWRNLTTERAIELNAVLKNLISNNTFKNIEVVYIDTPLPAAFERWKKMGRNAWELVEPVDGLHPSQAAHALNTELIFEILSEKGVLPKRNPNNGKIKEKFGDQGGYL